MIKVICMVGLCWLSVHAYGQTKSAQPRPVITSRTWVGIKRGPDVFVESAYNQPVYSPCMLDPQRRFGVAVESTMGRDWVNFNGVVRKVWPHGIEVAGWYRGA